MRSFLLGFSLLQWVCDFPSWISPGLTNELSTDAAVAGGYHCPSLVLSQNYSVLSIDEGYYHRTLCTCDNKMFGVNGACVRCPSACTCSDTLVSECFPVLSTLFAGSEGSMPLVEVTAILTCPLTVTGASLCNPNGLAWPGFEVSPDSFQLLPLNLSQWCYAGHRDRLCSRCAEGYFSSGRWCLPCMAGSWGLLVVLAYLLLFAALVAYLYARSPSPLSSVHAVSKYHYALQREEHEQWLERASTRSSSSAGGDGEHQEEHLDGPDDDGEEDPEHSAAKRQARLRSSSHSFAGVSPSSSPHSFSNKKQAPRTRKHRFDSSQDLSVSFLSASSSHSIFVGSSSSSSAGGEGSGVGSSEASLGAMGLAVGEAGAEAGAKVEAEAKAEAEAEALDLVNESMQRSNPLRLLVFHGQQLSILLLTATSLPPVLAGMMSVVSSGSGFSLSSILALECLTSHWGLAQQCWAALVAPGCVLVFAGAVWLWERWVRVRRRGQRLSRSGLAALEPSKANRWFGVCISLLYVMVFPCAQTALDGLACTDFREVRPSLDDNAAAAASSSSSSSTASLSSSVPSRIYLNLYPWQECDSAWQGSILPPALLGAVAWFVAFPLLSTWAFHAFRHRLHRKADSDVWPLCADLLRPYKRYSRSIAHSLAHPSAPHSNASALC